MKRGRRRGSAGGGRTAGRGGGSGTSGRGAGTRRLTRRSFLGIGASVLGVAVAGGVSVGYAFRRINEIGGYAPERLAALRGGASSMLFDRYPALADVVPWRPLTTLPTPVSELPQLDGARDIRLFVKREDLSAPLYGGNKVRKLEHFLAEAALLGRSTILTVGATGTNHGLATALHGGALGFDVRIALYDQPLTSHVRRNIHGLAGTGARLQYSGSVAGALLDARRVLDNDPTAYFIMAGGSSRLGTIGYVNAGLELAAQVRAGTLPEPDRLFVAAGTCGTAAGLIVGCRLAGLRTRVTAVRVAEPLVTRALTIRAMARDVAAFLHAADATVPEVRIGFGDFDVVTDQLGDGYGHPTSAAAAALEWAAPRLMLETTYTAKALAGCLDYCRGRARPGETVLFWNTINSAPVRAAERLDALPAEVRRMVGT
jgi:D-cysteine desulfhydrase